MSLWKSVTILLIFYLISFAIWALLHEGKELPLFQDHITHSIYKATFLWFGNILQTKYTQKEKWKDFVAHYTFPWISPNRIRLQTQQHLIQLLKYTLLIMGF